MAKGLRSTVKKRNRAKLRASIMGPADFARTERLSAKLQELASQPRPTNGTNEQVEVETTKQPQDNTTKDRVQIEDMDLDSESKAAKPKVKPSSQHKRSNGIRKLPRRKEKNLSVFPNYRLKRHQRPPKKQK